MSEPDKVPVYISKSTYERVREFISRVGGFSTVEELVEFVLREVLSGGMEGSEISREDEEKVKERLRALGYI